MSASYVVMFNGEKKFDFLLVYVVSHFPPFHSDNVQVILFLRGRTGTSRPPPRWDYSCSSFLSSSSSWRRSSQSK